MGGFETILYRKTGHLAYITLNRPKVLNIYNVRMRDELYEALSAIKIDTDVHVVTLRGAGDKAFCAGADLGEFLSAPHRQPPAMSDGSGMYGGSSSACRSLS